MKSTSLDRLLEVLAYDPETGVFTWVAPTNRRIRVGQKAGYRSNGYVYIRVDGATYPAHVLAWLFVTGQWPEREIDHRNRVRNDNRFANLREATRKQNAENLAPLTSANTSGSRGVNFYHRTGRWRAFIGHHGKRIHLGFFATSEEAVAARAAAERALFTHAATP